MDVIGYDDVATTTSPPANVIGDGKDEIIVGDADFGMIIVYSATGEELKRLEPASPSTTTTASWPATSSPAAALDEIAIVNSEDDGRIDVFDVDRNLLRTAHSGLRRRRRRRRGRRRHRRPRRRGHRRQRRGGAASTPSTSPPARSTSRDSAYDSDDKLGAGDVTGDGARRGRDRQHRERPRRRHQLLRRRRQLRLAPTTATTASRSAPSASGDIDGDSIPDRVELLGIRDAQGRRALRTSRPRARARAARTSWSRVDHMTGHRADPSRASTNVVKTFAAATEVKPVAELPVRRRRAPSDGHGPDHRRDSTSASMIPPEATVKGTEAISRS